jgi:hypothetical protein
VFKHVSTTKQILQMLNDNTKNTRDENKYISLHYFPNLYVYSMNLSDITETSHLLFVGNQNQHVTFRQARKSLMLCGLAVRKYGSDSHRARRPTIWHQTQ